jgi:hypothetical protein
MREGLSNNKSKEKGKREIEEEEEEEEGVITFRSSTI